MIKKDRFGKLCKEHMTNEILARFKERPNFFITGYMGLTVSDLEHLRRSLKKSSSAYFVVKNSILKVVLEKLGMASETSKIDSGMGISLGGEDIIAACKALASFAKEHEKFKIKGAVIDGKSLSADKVKELACLPPKEVLLAQVVGGIKAPITGFVNTLSGVLRKFICVVAAIKTARQSSSAAANPPADVKA
ncbi:MAG: 50S ribosomal protein L10 [Candidatus Omnitrophota bacterium]|nr:50S ribosomal protein L10 [Candidatus Omnitrophota bacterium]